MSIKMSYSKLTKIEYCPRLYELYYLKGFRSLFEESPLLFGSAMDLALNRLLLEKKKSLTEEETAILQKNEYDNFDELWLAVKDKPMVVYSKKDYDASLLSYEDVGEIGAFIKANCKALFDQEEVEVGTDLLACVDSMIEFKSAKNELNEAQHKLIALASWLSMRSKAHMLLSAYREQILPTIDEVFEIQRKIEMTDEEGNIIEGYIDFIASFVEDKDRHIVDNKTSSKAYKDDSVRTSDQLSLYATAMGLDKAAYAVMEKEIRKKEPRVRVNVIRDNISNELITTTLDKFNNAIYTHNSGEFPTSGIEKGCRPFGKLCEMYSYCHKGSMDYLTIKERKDETRRSEETGAN